MDIPDQPASTAPPLEIAHVLFMDIVAYSKLPMDQQLKLLNELQEVVRSTRAYAHAHNEAKLISLPTGDGMALVFFDNPESPVRCAIELSTALREHPEIKLRMGIHSGPVYRVDDINAASNVAGGGINMAQRVMDCGDTEHILVSQTVADVLAQVSTWSKVLQDLGDAEVKHGIHVHIYNLCTEEAGNKELPQKLRSAHRVMAAAAKRKRRLLAMVVAGVVVALAAGGVLYSRTPHKLTEKDSIVIGDFDNQTGDAVFDDTLRQGLSVQLEQSPLLVLLSDDTVNRTLKLMGRPAGERLTPELTREVCQRTGSTAMLTGSIAKMGSQYVIGLKALNCKTGDVLAQAQAQAVNKEGVLKALDDAAVSARRKLGESHSSLQKYATPLEEATTPSLEALKAYSRGEKTLSLQGEAAALPDFERAVELDPNFAMAYRALGMIYSNLGEGDREMENHRKAYALRERVSERERLEIEGGYLQSTGELEKAAQVYEQLVQTYPTADSPHEKLGLIYAELGKSERALDEDRKSLRLDPNDVTNYEAIGADYENLNQLDQAAAVYKQAEERKLDGIVLVFNRYELAFDKGDRTQMAEFASAATGKPGTEDTLLALQADTEGWYGKLKNAHELTRRAMDSAERNDANERAAGYLVLEALRDVESGNRERAHAEASAALKLAPNRDVKEIGALALALAGDAARAEKLVFELDKTFPRGTLVQRYWLPTIRAAIALERGDPQRAIELLKSTTTTELGQASPINVTLCPAYVRGKAYLMLHNGTGAAAEFQKYIDHYGRVANFPWGALARLGVARAYATEGDTTKAKAAYQDFLTLWKDADPDVPILQQAKAEYAKLK